MLTSFAGHLAGSVVPQVVSAVLIIRSASLADILRGTPRGLGRPAGCQRGVDHSLGKPRSGAVPPRTGVGRVADELPRRHQVVVAGAVPAGTLPARPGQSTHRFPVVDRRVGPGPLFGRLLEHRYRAAGLTGRILTGQRPTGQRLLRGLLGHPLLERAL